MIPVFKPYIGPDTLQAAVESLELGWLGMGSYVKRFEEELAAFLELPADRHLVAVNTGTSALHLALKAAGIGPGDEVLTPALNNIGDCQAIGMCGARPAFVDIVEETLGIDVASAERAVAPGVKAVIVLHYMGVPCDLEGVYRFAAEHDLRVIEDAAHAVGTRVADVPIGASGDLTCFSFDAIKTLTCIDGGAVVTPSADEAASLYPARLLGMTQSNEQLYANSRAYSYDVTDQGYRYHLANLHGAIGLSQLARLPEFIRNRRAYARFYNDALGAVDGLVVPQTDFTDVSVFHYVIRVLDGKRSELADHLRANGVETGIHWLPVNGLSWLKDCRGADAVPVTDRVGAEILTLPLWSFMPEEVLSKVADAIRGFFGHPPCELTLGEVVQAVE